jgi:hypothetical protein
MGSVGLALLVLFGLLMVVLVVFLFVVLCTGDWRRCDKCEKEFRYTFSDIQITESGLVHYVYCPHCHENNTVTEYIT